MSGSGAAPGRPPRRAVGVLGTGSYAPTRALSNDELAQMVDTSDEWITTRTGIKTRRIADAQTATSDLAAEAGRRAIADAKIDPDEIEMIIVATATPDMLFPASACIVQSALGLKSACAFDVSAACSGFVYSLSVANSLIASGAYRKILVIGAETLSKIVDWTDRNTCVLFGDGAGAAVLGEVEPGCGIQSVLLGSDGTLSHWLHMPGGGSRMPVSQEVIEQRLHYVKMNGNSVFKYAVVAMGTAALSALDQAGASAADLDILVPHQANLRIIEAVADRIGVPMSKVFVNLDRYGNTSAASVPIALDEAWHQGRLKRGDLVEVVVFGGGFTWGAAVLRW
jgi:3-oxoacyl-[acyl-carrier-protein] synthase-3